jgi:hypothetical protein
MTEQTFITIAAAIVSAPWIAYFIGEFRKLRRERREVRRHQKRNFQKTKD